MIIWQSAYNKVVGIFRDVLFGLHTVDGRNPAPVDMVNILLFAGIFTSQVVQDFFHQQ